MLPSKKTQILLLTAFILLAMVSIGLYFLYSAPGQETTRIETVEDDSLTKEVETPFKENKPAPFVPLSVPEGWRSYINEEWGVALAYPAWWSTHEEAQKYGWTAEGEGYRLRIDNIGRGASPDWTYAYSVDGQLARTWMEDDGAGYFLMLGSLMTGNQSMILRIHTPTKSLELVEELIHTINLKDPVTI